MLAGDVAFRVLQRLRQDGEYKGTVTILDINEEMIKQGQKRADERKLQGMANLTSSSQLACCHCESLPDELCVRELA
jgi:ubiquinone/menaquinone biosynthesis C-methylase UbiE